MNSRRKFIRDSALATGGLLLTSSSFANVFAGRKPFVIIIGAGFAGLSAAASLKKRSIPFVILESRNRVSGRVFSQPLDNSGGLVVELGAEWVGNSHTRVHDLCNGYGLALENNQFNTHLIYKDRYYRSGEWNYSDDWLARFRAMTEEYPNLTVADKKKIDKTDWWRYLTDHGCDGRDLEIRELLDSTDFGESIRSVSAFAALAEYAESSEKNEMDLKIRGGNSQLAFKMAEECGYENICLEHRVQQVTQTRHGGVMVKCSNGKEFRGDKIICTAPAFAVAKINWEPGLPDAYKAALHELQYARINKNPLLFRERFWKDESFDMITDQTPHYFYHATKNQSSVKGALISYTIGEKAALVANQSDEWKANMLNQTLSPFFGDIKPLLEKQLNYYWGNDEISRGAYAIYGKGQWFRVQPELKKSHLHTHFAGEHLAD